VNPDLDAEPDDTALLEAHLEGDPDAFGALFTRHRDRLWAVALRTTGNPEDAADALQDALISAFRRAESFRGDSAVTTWLHRIVVNACLDRLRRAKVRSADPLPDDLEENAARGSVLAGSDPAGDPEAHALADDRRRRLLAALGELPPDQKAALVLVDMEGYPVQEAGRILEVPTGTIKSRCARGRARLAVLLADLDTRPTRDADLRADPGGTRAALDASHSGDPPNGPPVDPPSPRPDLPQNQPQPGSRPEAREEVSGHE
jgi:RNA polymerase sigma-70 factor (ECF subfamily)